MEQDGIGIVRSKECPLNQVGGASADIIVMAEVVYMERKVPMEEASGKGRVEWTERVNVCVHEICRSHACQNCTAEPFRAGYTNSVPQMVLG